MMDYFRFSFFSSFLCIHFRLLLCCCHTLNHNFIGGSGILDRCVCVFVCLWLCVCLYLFSNFHHFPFPKNCIKYIHTLYTQYKYILVTKRQQKRKIQFIPQFICIRKVVNEKGAFLDSVTLIRFLILYDKFYTSLPIAINFPLSFIV